VVGLIIKLPPLLSANLLIEVHVRLPTSATRHPDFIPKATIGAIGGLRVAWR